MRSSAWQRAARDGAAPDGPSALIIGANGIRSGRAAVALAWLLGAASPTAGAAEVATPMRAQLRGMRGPEGALVSIASAAVELLATPRVTDGVPLGVASFDEVRCTIAVRNSLDRAVQGVVVELRLERAAQGDATGLGRPGTDDEASGSEGGAAADSPSEPIAGWTFRYSLEDVEPGAEQALPCFSKLPAPPSALGSSQLPTSLFEVTFVARVVGYRVAGLGLARGVEMVASGAEADVRAAFDSYGVRLSDEDRARDEALLWQLLAPPPAPAAAHAPHRRSAKSKEVANRADPRRTMDQRRQSPTSTTAVKARADTSDALPLGFVFLLRAAVRIGSGASLANLLVAEDRLVTTAPPTPEPVDGGRPPPLGDLLPPSIPAAIHEALIEIARRNLASFYALLHAPAEAAPSPPLRAVRPVVGSDAAKVPPSEGAVEKADPLREAAERLAEEEELDAPASWLEALSEDLVAKGTAGTGARQGVEALVEVMGRLGGDEVVEGLGHVLGSNDERLRASAAKVLVRRGNAGLVLVLAALDTEDQGLRDPLAASLWSLQGRDRGLLLELARARGAIVEDQADARTIVGAVDAAYAAARRRAVIQLLARSEMADPKSKSAMELIGEARSLSPRVFASERERLARLAAQIYRARAAAAMPDARALLDEVHAMGPVQEPAFREAWRDALIAEARARSIRDLGSALSLLDEGQPLPLDPVLLEAARSLIVERIDAAIDGHDTVTATARLALARRYGVPEAHLAARMRKLRVIAMVRPLLVGGLLFLLVGTAGFALARRRSGRAT